MALQDVTRLVAAESACSIILIFAVGIVLGMLGYVGDVYSGTTATILMLGTWFIGGAAVNIFTEP